MRGGTVPRTAELKTRISPDLKEAARDVYERWGISLSDAVNAFLVKSVEVGGLPFDMRPAGYNWQKLGALRPNQTTGQILLPSHMNDDDEGLYDDLV